MGGKQLGLSDYGLTTARSGSSVRSFSLRWRQLFSFGSRVG